MVIKESYFSTLSATVMPLTDKGGVGRRRAREKRRLGTVAHASDSHTQEAEDHCRSEVSLGYRVGPVSKRKRAWNV